MERISTTISKYSIPAIVLIIYYFAVLYMIGKWSEFDISVLEFVSIKDIINFGLTGVVQSFTLSLILVFILILLPREATDLSSLFDFVSKKQSPKKEKFILSFLLFVVFILLENTEYKIYDLYFLLLTFSIISIILIALKNQKIQDLTLQYKKLPILAIFFPIISINMFSNGMADGRKIKSGDEIKLIYKGSNIEIFNTYFIGRVGETDFYYKDDFVYIVQNQVVSKYQISKR